LQEIGKNLLNSAVPVGVELQAEGMEAVSVDRVADLLHQVQVIVQVVDGVQARTQDLLRAVQVVQVLQQ
jgi:hypothetical protein